MKNIIYESLTYNDPVLPIIFHLDKLEKNQIFLSHWHENIELLYVIEGCISVFTEQGYERVKKGGIAVVNSGSLHKISADEDSMYYCLIIDNEMYEKFSFSLGSVIFENLIVDKKLTDKYKGIVKELENKKPYHKAAVKSAIIDMIVYLSRYYVIKKVPDNEYCPDTKIQTVKTTIKYIQEEYNKNISTSGIARFVGLSDAYLCRLFKELTGYTVMHYINLFRCQKAKMLIRSENYTVSEAAFACGFENLSYFTKTYKRYIGNVPSEKAY